MRIVEDIESRPPVHIEFSHQELVELHKAFCEEGMDLPLYDETPDIVNTFLDLLCEYWDEENK